MVLEEVKFPWAPTKEYRFARYGDGPLFLQQKWSGGYIRTIIGETTNCPQPYTFDIEEWRDEPIAQLSEIGTGRNREWVK